MAFHRKHAFNGGSSVPSVASRFLSLFNPNCALWDANNVVPAGGNTVSWTNRVDGTKLFEQLVVADQATAPAAFASLNGALGVLNGVAPSSLTARYPTVKPSTYWDYCHNQASTQFSVVVPLDISVAQGWLRNANATQGIYMGILTPTQFNCAWFRDTGNQTLAISTPVVGRPTLVGMRLDNASVTEKLSARASYGARLTSGTYTGTYAPSAGVMTWGGHPGGIQITRGVMRGGCSFNYALTTQQIQYVYDYYLQDCGASP